MFKNPKNYAEHRELFNCASNNIISLTNVRDISPEKGRTKPPDRFVTNVDCIRKSSLFLDLSSRLCLFVDQLDKSKERRDFSYSCAHVRVFFPSAKSCHVSSLPPVQSHDQTDSARMSATKRYVQSKLSGGGRGQKRG